MGCRHGYRGRDSGSYRVHSCRWRKGWAATLRRPAKTFVAAVRRRPTAPRCRPRAPCEARHRPHSCHRRAALDRRVGIGRPRRQSADDRRLCPQRRLSHEWGRYRPAQGSATVDRRAGTGAEGAGRTGETAPQSARHEWRRCGLSSRRAVRRIASVSRSRGSAEAEGQPDRVGQPEPSRRPAQRRANNPRPTIRSEPDTTTSADGAPSSARE